MDYLEQSFSVKFEYRVHFTSGLFQESNTVFNQFLWEKKIAGITQKILFVIDKGVLDARPSLGTDLEDYFSRHDEIILAGIPLVIPGGEAAKNDPALFDRIVAAIDEYGIDRHSYLAAIGGGAVLDLAGYAAAVSHRGIRHIRIPTTVLSQNDSGVGVKNGINHFNKKNFLGTFAPPVAVFNDADLLTTLTDRDWRSGIAEAIKVALIKDAVFFDWIEAHTGDLAGRDLPVMKQLIKRCAELHLEHIAGGDPFEQGSSRPLDFGHWSAHKLEQLTDFGILHGEAVAMGIALDSVYSAVSGRLPEAEAQRIVRVLKDLGFAVTHPLMQVSGDDSPVLKGLQEFREHLGGQLTIMLLPAIGKGEEVHEIDISLLRAAGERLRLMS